MILASRFPALATATVLLVAGCFSSQHVSEIRPGGLDGDVPSAYANGTGSIEANAPSRWWLELDDPTLAQLIEDAMDDNLDLRQAFKRIEQMEAVARQSESGMWPQVEASASAGRSQRFSPPPIGAQTNNSFGIGLNAAYEIDVWGRVAALRDASQHDASATRYDAEAMALALAAQIADAWYEIRYQRARRELLLTQITIRESYLEIVELRLNYGQGTALDLLQQQQQVESIKAQLPLIDAAELTSQYRLAVLTGEPPGVVISDPPKDLPILPAPPTTGVPADLLERRPDLRSAQYRAASADARVVVAIADRLPSVRLSGGLSLSALDPVDLFDQIFWSVLASVAAPLIDGGRREAEIDRTEAVYDERLLAYGARLLTAMEEVESALVREREQARFIQALESQKVLAESTLETARFRYERGSGDYLRVLQSLEALQSIEQALLDAERGRLRIRIQLYNALGGTWTRAIEDPNPRGEE